MNESTWSRSRRGSRRHPAFASGFSIRYMRMITYRRRTGPSISRRLTQNLYKLVPQRRDPPPTGTPIFCASRRRFISFVTSASRAIRMPSFTMTASSTYRSWQQDETLFQYMTRPRQVRVPSRRLTQGILNRSLRLRSSSLTIPPLVPGRPISFPSTISKSLA